MRNRGRGDVAHPHRRAGGGAVNTATSHTRRALLRASVAAIVCNGAILCFGAAAAMAQAFPAKPVRVIVPFPPGGGADALARLIGPRLTEIWGQQVIIENRPGASGHIG